MIAALRKLRRDEQGNVATSLIFAVFVSAFVGAMVLICANTINTTRQTALVQNTRVAVDNRFTQYAAEAETSSRPNTDDVCYPALQMCVAIIGGPVGGDRNTVTLAATPMSGGNVVLTTRQLHLGPGTVINGFDSDGNPTWTR